MYCMTAINLLKKNREGGAVFYPPALLLASPGLVEGNHIVKKTIHHADGQADRWQMDWGKKKQILVGSWWWRCPDDRHPSRTVSAARPPRSLRDLEVQGANSLPAPAGLPSPRAATAPQTDILYADSTQATHAHATPPPPTPRRASLREPRDSSRDRTGGGSRAGTRMPAQCQGLAAIWHTVNRRSPSM